MIALDTNVLVRLLTNDNPAQAKAAQLALDDALRNGQQVWVSLLVLCELVWVLQGLYGYSKPQILLAFNALLGFAGLEVQQHTLVRAAVDVYQLANADFADVLLGLSSLQKGADTVLTFDKKTAKLSSHRLLGK
jgi:predicted nucleic-acid-binding protein